MQLVSSIKHIYDQFRYTPQEISTKYNNEQKQFTQQNTESKLSTLSRCIDINIQHQNTPSQLKTARFHITFEFELTELQDQYSYDHKHLGGPCKVSGLDLSANHKTNFVQTSQNKLRGASSIKCYNFQIKRHDIEAQNYCQSKAVGQIGV